MITRKGNNLLLYCGHSHVLAEPAEVDCPACEAGDTLDGSNLYLCGYRAGLTTTHGVELETMERLARVWLERAKADGHNGGCLCQGCAAAHRILAITKTSTKGLYAHGMEDDDE